METTVSFSLEPLETRSILIGDIDQFPPGFPSPSRFALRAEARTDNDTLGTDGVGYVGFWDVLLINRDTQSRETASLYRDAIERSGRGTEDVYSAGRSFAPYNLQRRELVALVTGGLRDETIPDSARGQLRSYLAAGGHLLLVGPNIAEDLRVRDSLFLREVLHTRWAGKATTSDHVAGIPTDTLGGPITEMDLAFPDGSVLSYLPDRLQADSSAIPFLAYTGPLTGAYAGFRYADASTGAKVVFLGFDLESVTGPAGESLLVTILNWFAGIVPESEQPQGPLSYTLEQNYPNPFNPVTVIPYQLPSSSHVRLVVVDLLGRELDRLVDADQPAGRYEIQWDAHRWASGVYIFQLTSGTFAQSRKMVLLR